MREKKPMLCRYGNTRGREGEWSVRAVLQLWEYYRNCGGMLSCGTVKELISCKGEIVIAV